MNDPLQTVLPRKSYEDFLPIFQARNIRYVRIQWVDLNNQVRAHFLSLSYFRQLLESERPAITVPKAILAVVGCHLAPGFSLVGERVYVIDLSSFRSCGYAPGHAVCFGFFQEHVPVPRPSGLSFDVPHCPRTVLSRLIRYATEELGIQFLVGVETEFVLLKSTNPVVPVNDHQYCTTMAITTGTVETRILEEIADAIEADGIKLQMFHSEGGAGQYEIVTGPMPPLEAADALVHTRETIYNIANKHGLRATFAPKLAVDSFGSGAHTHVSIRGNRPGISGSELLTAAESAFLAGLMHHLPSVIALTLPLTASYARMQDGVFAGGTWVCWGVDNREAPVRLTKPYVPSSRRFEIRPVDGTSNPYLAITGILASGVLGVRDGLELMVKNCNGAKTAAEMTEEERAALGITARFPLSAEEARQRFVADEGINGLLGAELVEHFVALNRMLAQEIDRREGESEAQALTRLVENY